MSVFSPEKYWWDEPLDEDEKRWVKVALAWCILITVAMPWWHVTGSQNPPSETYRISTDKFEALTEQFVAKYKVGTETGKGGEEKDVVKPPAGADVFVRGKAFSWDPILKLEKGKTYRVHLSSTDFLHGYSIQPINMNFEAVPGYDYVLKLTPTTTGVFNVVCNEFCGIGHHAMVGKMYVD